MTSDNRKTFTAFLRLEETRLLLESIFWIGSGVFVSWIIHPDGFARLATFCASCIGGISPGDDFAGWRVVIVVIFILIGFIRGAYRIWSSND